MGFPGVLRVFSGFLGVSSFSRVFLWVRVFLRVFPGFLRVFLRGFQFF